MIESTHDLASDRFADVFEDHDLREDVLTNVMAANRRRMRSMKCLMGGTFL
jgi:hypothetical protein